MLVPGIPDTDIVRTHYWIPSANSIVEYKHLPSGIRVRRERPRDVSIVRYEDQIIADFVDALKRGGIIPAAPE